VPTPFYHLSIADDILKHPELVPEMKGLIKGQLGAFYLGNTAPDVQVISGQKRSATHFFPVPIPADAEVPWEILLSRFPDLRASRELIEAQAVFISGYLCHLQADWIWVSEIFEPIFGPSQTWASFSERLYWHNILRAFLDVEVLEDLPVDRILEIGPPGLQLWLPIIRDQDLETWWKYLCEQLEPGKSIKTFEVFAARQRIDVLEFQAKLESEEVMQENIFNHISRQQLDDYRTQLVEKNISLLYNYLGPRIAPDSEAVIPECRTAQQVDRSSL
jgi:hypothetical protein